METENQLIEKPAQRFIPNLPRDAISRLFAVMTTTYPSFQPNSEMVADWTSRLKRIPDNAISYAQHIMIEPHPKYAPTIGEFKKLCKDNAPRAQQSDLTCKHCRGSLVGQYHADACTGGRFQP